MALVLRATNDNGVVADLDLRQEADLRLDISAIENTEIGRVFGVSTQTFALPDTPNNNQFFGNLFNLGTTPSVALQDSIPCQLLQDGTEVMRGKMYIVDIVTNQKGKTFYNVNVINETIDFKLKIENADNPFLAGLDWSEYDHICNYYSITGSWYNQPLSGSSANYPTGSIIYPHVNYGITPNTDEPQYAFGGQQGKIDNSSTPLTSLDFKPAIRVKDVVDKIFETVDYKYTSSFFDTDFFKNLYMLSTNNEEKGVAGNPISGSVEAYSGPNQDITGSLGNYPAKLTFDTETYDNGNSWDTGTSTYTANQYDGVYRFATFVTYQYLNVTIPSGVTRTLTLEFWVNGVPYSQQYVPTAPTYGQIFLQANIPLEVGDTVEVYLTAYSSNPAEYLRVYGTAANTYFLAASPFSGNQVNMGAQFPAELKMIEFLGGLIEKFNLVIEPDKNERNLLIIEPYDTWLANGEVKDWTDKVDRSIDYKIIHPITEQPKTIYFSDEEDDDLITKYTKENFGRIYGDYYYTTESDLANGERRIGKVFAPCPVKGIDGGGQFIIPHMCRKEANEEPRPMRFKPRLVQAIGLHSASLDAQGFDVTTSTYNPGKYWMLNEDGNTPVSESFYYAVGALSSVNNDFDSDTSLHFNTVQHYDYQEPFANGHVKQDTVQNYWSTYLNSELYDIDSRKLTCNVYLKPTEYFDFQLNDNIFIDGHYYRINKISGGNLSRKDSVQVELIKILKRRLKYPRRRLSSGDVIVIEPAGLSRNGSATIVSDVTGNAVSGSQIGGYANQLGLATYPIGNGDVQAVWNYQGGSNMLPSAKVAGNNNIDSGTTNTLAMGNNNNIGSSTNGIVVGNSHTVGQLSTNVTAIGNEHSATRQTSNVQFLGGSDNYVGDITSDSTLVGGTQLGISGSSLVTMVGGANNSVLYSPTSRDVVLGGLNVTVSASQNTVVINGNGETSRDLNGHTVIGNFQDTVTITGSDFRSGTNIIAGTYLEEEYYTNRNSHQIEVYNGSTEYAYSGTGLYKYIYEIDFNTVPSGSGTGTIELPTIIGQEQIGRTILFKLSDSFSADNKVIITSYANTDKIEGQDSYALERPGQWVELRGSQYPEGESLKTGWRVMNAGVPFESSVTNEGAYGSFYSTTTQAIAVSGSAQLVTLNNTFASNLIALSGSGAIEMDYRGAYSFTWTAKVQNADNVIHFADFWVKYNGADYPNSTVRAAIPARKNASEFTVQPVTVQLLDVAVNNGDKIELYWRGDSTLLSLQYQTFGGSIPAAPSIRATIHAV